jgi:hypothetical protein
MPRIGGAGIVVSGAHGLAVSLTRSAGPDGVCAITGSRTICSIVRLALIRALLILHLPLLILELLAVFLPHSLPGRLALLKSRSGRRRVIALAECSRCRQTQTQDRCGYHRRTHSFRV